MSHYISAISYYHPVDYIEKCRQEMVNFMEQHGWVKSDVPLSDALQTAVVYRNKEYVKFILENYIHDTLKYPACCPTIFQVIRNEADDILELLCQRAQEARIELDGVPYIDVRGCQTEECKTPLHLAVELGRVEAVKTLLRYGADADLTDQYEQTALERGLRHLLVANDELQEIEATLAVDLENFSRLQIVSEELTKKCSDILNCVVEICDAMTSIPKCDIPHLQEVLQECFYELPYEYTATLLHVAVVVDSLFQPSALVKTCRHVIRKSLGYLSLPHDISKLGLPRYLSNYLLLNIKERSASWEEFAQMNYLKFDGV